MNEFNYRRPANLQEVLAALKGAPEAKLLAGGMSLIPVLKLGLASPSELISLRDVAELRGITFAGTKLVIGAASTHAEVAASAVAREAIPALARLAESIGDPQVRNRGTLGGSVAHADPAADYPAALLALDATVQTDRREVAAADWFTGMFSTALEADEVVVAVHFPIPEKAAYAKFANPASRFAIAGVFVARGAGGVRVAVTGAGPSVFRATAIEDALSTRWSAAALDGVTVPADDLLTDPAASAEYRAHLIGVMARRAVVACG